MVELTASQAQEAVESLNAARRAASDAPGVDARRAEGKALRTTAPRSSHADWSPPADRPDPVDLLEEQNKTRLQELVPIRYGRMLVSPFAFLRGSATVMARDLSSTPTSGLIVQACGDAHIANFGSFATPERNLVFDLNDFDETLPAPWEWDVKRFAASIVVAGRTNGFSAADCTSAVSAAIHSYQQHLATYAQMTHLAVWYSHIDAADVMNSLASATKKFRKAWAKGAMRARQHDTLHAFSKMTEVVDGETRFIDHPPLIEHFSDEMVGHYLPIFAEAYRDSLRDDQRILLGKYHFADFAQKTVGVGSVGTRCFIALLEGSQGADPLLLQGKEASASVLEPYAGKSQYQNQGERVVRGQQYIQATSDIFLGWGKFEGVDLYVRQLRDMKGSAEISLLGPQQMSIYGEVCGWALARAHARSGDAAKITGYIGTDSTTFNNAITTFAHSYADQTERDYATLVAAAKDGRITADTGI